MACSLMFNEYDVIGESTLHLNGGMQIEEVNEELSLKCLEEDGERV